LKIFVLFEPGIVMPVSRLPMTLLSNISHSDDDDIRAVHLETAVDIEFRNNMEFAGGEGALGLSSRSRRSQRSFRE
jgi:hypothetical protein